VSEAKVDVCELIAWELDEYGYRGSASVGQREIEAKVRAAKERLALRDGYVDCSALLSMETREIRHLLDAAAQRADLHAEYAGLEWALGVVDLRSVLAFQRRLVFGRGRAEAMGVRQDDWEQFVAVALGGDRSTECRVVRGEDDVDGVSFALYSNNPDLQLRLKPEMRESDRFPFEIYGGSPFFEVAEFRGRWFLRDGYHRAYRLLKAGVCCVPAVVIRARTIEELGATEPWFFGEEQLFSERPPRVTDFLDEGMVLRYERAALRKVIRVRVEESLEPFDEEDEVQGEEI
jgi:hypothetical protein